MCRNLFSFLETEATLHIWQEIADFAKSEQGKQCLEDSPHILEELVHSVLQDEGATPKEMLDHLVTRGWVEKAKKQVAQVESVIDQVMEKNSLEFQKFCKKRRRNFKFYFHGEEVHEAIKRTGFCLNPRMTTPDRVYCFDCKSSFSGFRAWHDPSTFHNKRLPHRTQAEYLENGDIVYLGSEQDQEST